MRTEPSFKLRQFKPMVTVKTSSAGATAATAGGTGGVGAAVGAATGAGAGAAAGAAGGGMKVSTMIMENLQKLIALNPEYLTSGIPNHVMTQLFMQPIRAPPQPQQQQLPNMAGGGGNATSAAATAAAAAAAAASAAAVYVQQEEDEVDYEEMGVAETYADYWPAKCK